MSEKPGLEESKRLIHLEGSNVDVLVVAANYGVIRDGLKQRLELEGDCEATAGSVSNTGCIVLAIRYGGKQIIVAGDETFSTEAGILNSEWGDHLESYALSGGTTDRKGRSRPHSSKLSLPPGSTLARITIRGSCIHAIGSSGVSPRGAAES